jgi:hypothetical protein
VPEARPERQEILAWIGSKFKLITVTFALGVILVCSANSARSQDIVGDALAWMPPDTVSLEYSNPATLRGLPNYQSLRARYLGRDLQGLEAALARLGIHESDIQELVLGWQTTAGKGFRYEGLATGALDPEAIARSAAASGINPLNVEGNQVYCFAANAGSTCVAVIGGSIGLFGPLPALQRMLKARAGDVTGASSNTQFAQLVEKAKSDAPIWGVASGQAVSKWFQAWLPGQKDMQMNWASAFRGVRSLSYEIEAESTVDLNVKLNCVSSQAASSLRQLMEGLKLIQQMAWQTTNPAQPNPFQNLEIDAVNDEVSFKLSADYAALERVGQLGRP